MVNMVLGQYTSKVADNGRVSLPKKFRDELGSRYIITQGYEGSLMIVPSENWEVIVKETTNKPFLIGQARATSRFLLGGASFVELDEQGRFIVPSYLKTYAQIGAEAVFLGLGQYIELWDMERWKSYQENLKENIENIAQKLGELPNK